MTPKEKAIHLVDSFLNMKRIKMSDYSVIYLPTAKECALITVEEILVSEQSAYSIPIEVGQIFVEYWEKVKEEINKL